MYVVIYLISIKFVDVVFWLLVRMLYYEATENSWEPDSSELPLSLTENELFSEYKSVNLCQKTSFPFIDQAENSPSHF